MNCDTLDIETNHENHKYFQHPRQKNVFSRQTIDGFDHGSVIRSKQNALTLENLSVVVHK